MGSAPDREAARTPKILPTGSMLTVSPASFMRSIMKRRPATSASLKATRLTPPCGLVPNLERSVRCWLTREPFTRQLFQLPCWGSALSAMTVPTNSRRFTSFALAGHLSPQGCKRIVIRIDNALFQRDDRVIGDRDRFRADLGAALRDVAEADPAFMAQVLAAIHVIQRMHLIDRRPHQHRGTDELLVLVMRAQDVADILAQEAFDAFPELLRPLDFELIHPPRSVRCVGLAWLEFRDALADLVIPRHVRHEVLDHGERRHRRDRDRLVRRVVGHPRHAHQLRLAVDLRGARAAFPGLAVPAHCEIGRLAGLDGVDGVEHDHPFSRRHLVVVKPTAITRSSKYAEQGHTLSLMSARRSAGIGGWASRRTAMRSPSFLITICSRAC